MVELGTYEHFKGGVVKVILNGVNEADQTPVIIYEHLDGDHGSTIWVRPETSFKEQVEVDGKFMPRFQLVRK